MRSAWLAIAICACGGAAAPAPASRPPPFESLTGAGAGAALATPDKDKQIIKRHIHTRAGEIRACYEQALRDQPGLAGRVDVTFVIDLDGRAQDVHASGMEAAPSVATCVAAEIAQIQFPKPRGGTVTVSYPFTFAAQAP